MRCGIIHHCSFIHPCTEENTHTFVATNISRYIFVATKHVFCLDKRQNICRDNNNTCGSSRQSYEKSHVFCTVPCSITSQNISWRKPTFRRHTNARSEIYKHGEQTAFPHLSRNRVYCIDVPGHVLLILSFRSFSFLIGWGFYGPNYLRC